MASDGRIAWQTTHVPDHVSDDFLDALIRLKCAGRDVWVSYWRILQAIHDQIHQEGLDRWHVLATGSRFEGMPLAVCNDMDSMFTKDTWPVVRCNEPDVISPQGYLTVSVNTRNPAYLILLTVPGLQGYDPDITISKVENKPHSPLSTDMFMCLRMSDDGEIQYTQGPACVKFLDSNSPEVATSDYVPCLSSPEFPEVASSFLLRNRASGWPSQPLIDKILVAGCHVVPVGHPASMYKATEWRWSFSMAEKELIHYMSEDMYCVMFLLKAIKNKFWQSEAKPTPFCSYFIKTACLWVSEITNETNIMDLCRLVIDWLLSCYQTHRLPHYFIPEQNLIGHLTIQMYIPVIQFFTNVKTHLRRHVNQLMLDELQGHHRFTNSRIATTTPKIKKNSKQWDLDMKLWHAIHSDFHEDSHMWRLLGRTISQSNNISSVLAIPERILLPMIAEIQTIITSECVHMFQTALYRYIGDLYQSLYTHYSKLGEEEACGKCYNKAELYYKEGLVMVYHNGWTDRGLGGYVRLAAFYHLNREREKLRVTLQNLEPLLEWAAKDDVISSLGPIVINKYERYALLPWQQDEMLSSELIAPHQEGLIRIHPILLGCYITARWIKDARIDRRPCGWFEAILRALSWIKRMRKTMTNTPDMLLNEENSPLILQGTIWYVTEQIEKSKTPLITGYCDGTDIIKLIRRILCYR